MAEANKTTESTKAAVKPAPEASTAERSQTLSTPVVASTKAEAVKSPGVPRSLSAA